MSATRPPIPATLIPGDGIGPEIVDATLAALDALNVPFAWDRQIAGLEGVTTAGDPLPKATLDSIRRRGWPEGPAGDAGRRRLPLDQRAPARGVQALRQPAPGADADARGPLRQHRPGRLPREPRRPLHGLRALHPDRGDPHAVAMSTGVNTRQGSPHILEFAFDFAIALGRKKVTVVHKANIMKALTGIFLETGRADVRRALQGPHPVRTGHHRRLLHEAGDEARGSSTCWSPPTCSATSCPT
jgi:isocitrate dehydrogenase (NAD+)